MKVSELTDGIEIDQVLLVRDVERRTRRDGGDYLRVQLGDRTGAVAAMVWDDLAEVRKLARPASRCTCGGATAVIPALAHRSTLRGLLAPAPGTLCHG